MLPWGGLCARIGATPRQVGARRHRTENALISWADLKNKFLFFLIFGLAIVAALAIYADLSRMMAALARFRWKVLPLALGLTLFNYALRWVKWDYYVSQIGAAAVTSSPASTRELRTGGRDLGALHSSQMNSGARERAGQVSKADSLIIFVSGFTMVLTPGRVGELLKSYLLKQADDIPISRSAPIVLAERLTDLLAMILLASAGLVAYRYGWQVMALVLVSMMAFVALVQIRPLALGLLSWGEGLPLIARFIQPLHQFYESSYQLLSLKNLLIAVGLSLISWGGECAALYVILVGLGFAATPTLLLQASFAFASSSVLGAISFLPGGLGVTDASLTGLLLLMEIAKDMAVAATLLIRLCTLWFGVSLGLATLFAFRKRFEDHDQD